MKRILDAQRPAVAPKYCSTPLTTPSPRMSVPRLLRRLSGTSVPGSRDRIVRSLSLVPRPEPSTVGPAPAGVGNERQGVASHVTHESGCSTSATAGVQRHGASVDRFRFGESHAFTASVRNPNDLTVRPVPANDVPRGGLLAFPVSRRLVALVGGGATAGDVTSIASDVPAQFESSRTGDTVSARGRQPMTLAWAHEEGMDIRPVLNRLIERLNEAEANDGVIDQDEMQDIRKDVAELHRETEQASVALEIAINDTRGSDNVARGGVRSALVLNTEAELMVMADELSLVVPNSHLRNRTRIRALAPAPMAIDAHA